MSKATPYMSTANELDFFDNLKKHDAFKTCADIVNRWLDGHPLDYRHERNKKIRFQIEEWAENLWEYGDIEPEQLTDYADTPGAMNDCDI